MADNWDFYLCMLEDGPASILVDLEAVDDAPSAALPRMAYVSVMVQYQDENGFPEDQEFEALAQLEDRLTEAAAEDGRSRYVGRCVNDGRIDYIFYSSLQSGWEELVAGALQDFERYEWMTGIHDEPDWATYLNFLYPDAQGMLDIQNRRMLHRLEKMGDDAQILRPIEHWLEFASQTDRDVFAREAAGLGFLSENPAGRAEAAEMPASVKGMYEAVSGKISLRICRNDAPSAMEEVTFSLAAAAEKHRGEYLGWACSVQEEASSAGGERAEEEGSGE